MNLLIHGSKNLAVSQNHKDYIQKRLEKLNYFKNHITDINFHLDCEKKIYKTDVVLNLKKLGTHKFHAQADEVYTAIDKIIHKIDVKIYREKTKIQEHSKASHEEMVEFFNNHEENKPEPTEIIKVNDKPLTLLDAYLAMKNEEKDFYGFYLIEANGNDIAFLRLLPDNVLYLFKRKDEKSYSEYSLIINDNNIIIDKEVREIELKKMSLLEAQIDILENDYYFDLYIDSNNNRICFLFKQGHGKWTCIS